MCVCVWSAHQLPQAKSSSPCCLLHAEGAQHAVLKNRGPSSAHDCASQGARRAQPSPMQPCPKCIRPTMEHAPHAQPPLPPWLQQRHHRVQFMPSCSCNDTTGCTRPTPRTHVGPSMKAIIIIMTSSSFAVVRYWGCARREGGGGRCGRKGCGTSGPRGPQRQPCSWSYLKPGL